MTGRHDYLYYAKIPLQTILSGATVQVPQNLRRTAA